MAIAAQTLLDQAASLNQYGSALPDDSAYYQGNSTPTIPGGSSGLVIVDGQIGASNSSLVALTSNTALAIVNRTSSVTVFGA